MENNVDQMVTQQAIAPQPRLNPESRMGKWILLLGRAELKPDTPKAAPGAQFRPGNVGVIIPNLSAIPSWLIRHQDGEEQDCQDQQVLPARQTRAGGRF
jgi:hypothetical protein